MSRIATCFAVTAGLVFMFAASSHAVVIGFNSPTYHDGDINGQDHWSGSANAMLVSNVATNGVATSTVNPGTTKTMVYSGFTNANTGLDLLNASGLATGGFDITLNSTSGASNMATIDFGRDSNNYRVMNMDVYQDGTVKIRTAIANVGGTDTTTTLSGFLTNGVKVSLSLDINYTNLKFRLYKGNSLVTLTGSDVNGWSPFSDTRNGDSRPAPTVGTFYFINRNAPSGSVTLDNISLNAVPEPATMVLLALGGLVMIHRKH